MRSSVDYVLRRATRADAEALHGLFRIPDVYRFLADGAPPARSFIEAWIGRSAAHEKAGLGSWLLEDRAEVLAGCVRLEALERPRAAELVYLLHPRVWGNGLATRMSAAVIGRAFARSAIDEIVAGADQPNVASIAVMRRLGMTFLRAVDYPLGDGVEYVLRRSEWAGRRAAETIPFVEDGAP